MKIIHVYANPPLGNTYFIGLQVESAAPEASSCSRYHIQ